MHAGISSLIVMRTGSVTFLIPSQIGIRVLESGGSAIRALRICVSIEFSNSVS